MIAVKTLVSDDETEFLKEKSILEELGPQKHPHLVKLYTTYFMDGKYHLVFPCASANLRGYWLKEPKPSWNMNIVFWSVTQMKGIAWALSCIHTFRVTMPKLNLSVDGRVRIQDDNGMLELKVGEEKYGRHGDIKPENILWYEYGSEHESENDKSSSNGVLQITDFGLGRFHGRDSRSGIDPRKVQGSLTYEPPECKLGRPVSRAYDMWSLGCLYLEFITWLLKGERAIHDFADTRGRQAPSSVVNDDSFFTTFPPDSNKKRDAEVREDVVRWVEGLRTHENCSEAIHDILHLVMEELLKVNASERILACKLNELMGAIVKHAERDHDYLMKPAPREARPARVKAKTARFAESHTWPLDGSP